MKLAVVRIQEEVFTENFIHENPIVTILGVVENLEEAEILFQKEEDYALYKSDSFQYFLDIIEI